MRTGMNRLTNELEIYLDKEEAEQMQRQSARENTDKVPVVTPDERTRG